MDRTTSDRTAVWWHVLRQAALWRRCLMIGGFVGLLQVAVNQGDVWLLGTVDGVVVFKTIASPLITITVAVISAVWADVERK
ncbi:MAG: hypothetical protein HZA46_24155 [Planctomycetales bacterium]|nr:hypothetical protein [Planctomycetales bacterium]